VAPLIAPVLIWVWPYSALFFSSHMLSAVPCTLVGLLSCSISVACALGSWAVERCSRDGSSLSGQEGGSLRCVVAPALES